MREKGNPEDWAKGQHAEGQRKDGGHEFRTGRTYWVMLTYRDQKSSVIKGHMLNFIG